MDSLGHIMSKAGQFMKSYMSVCISLMLGFFASCQTTPWGMIAGDLWEGVLIVDDAVMDKECGIASITLWEDKTFEMDFNLNREIHASVWGPDGKRLVKVFPIFKAHFQGKLIKPQAREEDPQRNLYESVATSEGWVATVLIHGILNDFIHGIFSEYIYPRLPAPYLIDVRQKAQREEWKKSKGGMRELITTWGSGSSFYGLISANNLRKVFKPKAAESH